MTVSLIKRFYRKVRLRLGSLVDFAVYVGSLGPYKQLAQKLPSPEQGSLLIVSGRGMNIHWAQLWNLLSLPIRMRGYRGLVLTMRNQRLLNCYYRLIGLDLVFLEDLEKSPAILPDGIKKSIQAARTFDDYRQLQFKNAPVGQIALSTYSRYLGTGVIDVANPETAAFVREWTERICLFMLHAEALFSERNVKVLFFTEVFMEEYGAFYYAALNADLNIIRFAGTVRDSAFIMQHLSKANDRIHHSSLDPMTWAKIKQGTNDALIEKQLMQNFQDRYGQKWHRSKRNHPNTVILDVTEARQRLGIAPGRKVAVIYSHILYDTLFFFGTDLFKSYAEWLVETTRAAIANPKIDWLIKVHPSNLWRGEFDTLLKGRYEEERLLQKEFGELPPHVRIIPADTPINPFTWFQLADFGITVRGTSGLEMAALGKSVITAGTGRYEGNGFTIDPVDASDYLKILGDLPEVPTQPADTAQLAKRYAHAIFVMKPFTLDSVKVQMRSGKKTATESNDLIFVPQSLKNGELAQDLKRFGEWALRPEDRDLLTVTTV